MAVRDSGRPVGLLGIEGLGGQQGLDEAVQIRAVLLQRLTGASSPFVENAAYLAVEQLTGLRGRLVAVEAEHRLLRGTRKDRHGAEGR